MMSNDHALIVAAMVVVVMAPGCTTGPGSGSGGLADGVSGSGSRRAGAQVPRRPNPDTRTTTLTPRITLTPLRMCVYK